MILKTIILFGIIIIIFVLIKYIKKLNKSLHTREICKFHISKPKFKSYNDKKYAYFDVLIRNKDTFFVDFPVMFKFYSNSKFKSRIKIIYTTPGAPEVEEIINKDMIFAGRVKEHIYYITDIIIGKIKIEIELKIDYGQPIISFEILENSLCELLEEHKIEIKFPK